MRPPKDVVEKVSLGSLRRYLRASGWSMRQLPNGNDLFTIKLSGEAIEIVLPEVLKARGAHDRVADALVTLSGVNDKPLADVIAAIRSIGYDLFRSHLPSPAIRSDTILMSTADIVIRQVRKLLAATAHIELHDSPYFSSADAAATHYADTCRFGHTFQGSFGFSIESPVGPNTEAPELSQIAVPPLERRAMERLALGLGAIRNAAHAKDVSALVEPTQRKLNANAYEGIAAILSAPRVSEVTFDVVLSKEWVARSGLQSSNSFRLQSAGVIEIVREAANELRRSESDTPVRIYGQINTLRSTENPSDLLAIAGTRDVIIEWKSREYGSRSVRVPLGPEDYLKAIEAHTFGRWMSVSGDLQKTARQWRLENPTGLEFY